LAIIAWALTVSESSTEAVSTPITVERLGMEHLSIKQCARHFHRIR
jgi:hypothetical protein